jgi:hypothetical protein
VSARTLPAELPELGSLTRGNARDQGLNPDWVSG